ncbi:putative glycolipid-binding domain-containing protein [Streptomyces lasiicapitis]|uniref:putative glycolipid-binding domain-containing protein n=1 Tax=Streptomyces lasiicapitis TaxID=1923961 RepID=UPI003646F6A7
MSISRVLTWQVTESTGYETAWAELDGRALRAHGRAVGTAPDPYWISYELDTGDDFVTRALRVTAEDARGVRELELVRDGAGQWSADGDALPELEGALDCDLGLCPLTNTMPVLRHGLHRSAAQGEQRFLVAWVSVPDLAVRASRQHYAPLQRTVHGARVRFTSGDYQRDVTFDADGFVVDYPGLAHRLARRERLPGRVRPSG